MSTLEFNNHLVALMSKLEMLAFQLTSDAEDAKDLIQETIYKALNNKDKFKPHGNFKAWLYTIMRNTFINDYRRGKRQIFYLQSAKYDAADRSPVAWPDSDYRCKEIEAHIQHLEEGYRLPFVRFRNGFKYEEIAQELDLPIGTVKSRIFQARKKLMDKLKDYGNV